MAARHDVRRGGLGWAAPRDLVHFACSLYSTQAIRGRDHVSRELDPGVYVPWPHDSSASSELFVAGDSTGSVSVTLNGSYRVVDLRVSARWRDKLAPDKLANAVLEAATKAAEQMEREPSESVYTSLWRRNVGTLIDAFAGLPPESVAGASRRMSELLDAAMADTFERLDRVLETRTARHVGTDDREHVKVTVVAPGTLTALDVDEEWIASVSRERLVTTIREAVDRAYEKLDAALAAVPEPRSTALEQLERLYDRNELRRWLEGGTPW